MADDTPVFLTRDAANRTAVCVRDFERRASTAPGRNRRNPVARGPLVGILLEDLQSGGTADVAVLAQVSSPAIQKISILGQPGPTDTFQLQFKGQTSIVLPILATSDQVEAALLALETIGPKNVNVELGYFNDPANGPENPGIFLVSFVGAFLSRDPNSIPLIVPQTGSNNIWIITTQTTQWADTGAVETVTAAVPVGSPTPMRAGATITAIQFPGVGYVLMTCEPRNFGTPY